MDMRQFIVNLLKPDVTERQYTHDGTRFLSDNMADRLKLYAALGKDYVDENDLGQTPFLDMALKKYEEMQNHRRLSAAEDWANADNEIDSQFVNLYNALGNNNFQDSNVGKFQDYMFPDLYVDSEYYGSGSGDTKKFLLENSNIQELPDSYIVSGQIPVGKNKKVTYSIKRKRQEPFKLYGAVRKDVWEK